MSRILITGAAGFIGSHLCDRFIREGYEAVELRVPELQTQAGQYVVQSKRSAPR